MRNATYHELKSRLQDHGLWAAFEATVAEMLHMTNVVLAVILTLPVVDGTTGIATTALGASFIVLGLRAGLARASLVNRNVLQGLQ